MASPVSNKKPLKLKVLSNTVQYSKSGKIYVWIDILNNDLQPMLAF